MRTSEALIVARCADARVFRQFVWLFDRSVYTYIDVLVRIYIERPSALEFGLEPYISDCILYGASARVRSQVVFFVTMNGVAGRRACPIGWIAASPTICIAERSGGYSESVQT